MERRRRPQGNNSQPRFFKKDSLLSRASAVEYFLNGSGIAAGAAHPAGQNLTIR
jgi:hypothetical protein